MILHGPETVLADHKTSHNHTGAVQRLKQHWTPARHLVSASSAIFEDIAPPRFPYAGRDIFVRQARERKECLSDE
jgi:hypothetical protein